MTDLSLSNQTFATKPASPKEATAFRLPTQWIGVAPFFIFALMFLILPTLYLVVGAFQNSEGQFTLDNILQLVSDPSISSSYWVSIKISFWSAIIGAFAGLAIAIAIVRGGLPSWTRSATLTFSGVASNFAGLPLAFAFLATLGRVGIVTTLLRDVLNINIYAMGFNFLTTSGLIAVYLFFQIPLMVVIIVPAHRRIEEGMGRGGCHARRHAVAVLAHGGHTGFVAELPRHGHPVCSPMPSAPSPPLMRLPVRRSTSFPSSSIRRSMATCCTTRNSAMPSPSA